VPGVREALSFGPSAPQPHGRSTERAGLADIEPISEDCLFLNVYAPSGRQGGRVPVKVWIHPGGGFRGESDDWNPVVAAPPGVGAVYEWKGNRKAGKGAWRSPADERQV
jgi:para-nitrobenzyl esterase